VIGDRKEERIKKAKLLTTEIIRSIIDLSKIRGKKRKSCGMLFKATLLGLQLMQACCNSLARTIHGKGKPWLNRQIGQTAKPFNATYLGSIDRAMKTTSNVGRSFLNSYFFSAKYPFSTSRNSSRLSNTAFYNFPIFSDSKMPQ